MKRMRAIKAKPGELKLEWSKLPHDVPDICFAWGDGCSKRDGNFLHHVLCSPRLSLNFGNERDESPYKFEISFVDDLKERGYDITTMKFYIRKAI